MYVIVEIEGNKVKVLDESDGVVDTFYKDELIKFNKKYNLNILGMDNLDLPAYDFSDFFADVERLKSFSIKTNVNLEKVRLLYGRFIYKYKDFGHVVAVIQSNGVGILYTDLPIVRATLCKRMFEGCTQLESVDLRNFDISLCTSMFGFFRNCSALKTINFDGINTEFIMNMAYLFKGCESLGSIDLRHFNTSRVINMRCMFTNCESLESLDLSGFDVHNTRIFFRMFLGCTKLKVLDLSTFNIDTRMNLNMQYMFDKGLKKLYVSSLRKVIEEESNKMLEECSDDLEIIYKELK